MRLLQRANLLQRLLDLCELSLYQLPEGLRDAGLEGVLKGRRSPILLSLALDNDGTIILPAPHLTLELRGKLGVLPGVALEEMAQVEVLDQTGSALETALPAPRGPNQLIE